MSFCWSSEGSKSCGCYSPPNEGDSESFVVNAQPWTAFVFGVLFPVVWLIVVIVVWVNDNVGAIIGISVGIFFISVNGVSEMGKTYLILDKSSDKIYKVRTGCFGLVASEKLLGVLSNFSGFDYVEAPCCCECCCCNETKVMLVFKDGIDQEITAGEKKEMEATFDPIRQVIAAQTNLL
eukprot:147201_1